MTDGSTFQKQKAYGEPNMSINHHSVCQSNTGHHSWRKDDKPGRQAILLLLLVSEKQKQKNLNLLHS